MAGGYWQSEWAAWSDAEPVWSRDNSWYSRRSGSAYRDEASVAQNWNTGSWNSAASVRRGAAPGAGAAPGGRRPAGRRLRLAAAGLGDEDLEAPGAGGGGRLEVALPGLGELDLSWNRLRCARLERLLDACADTSALRVVKLHHNKIGDAGAAGIAELCWRCPGLSELHLSHNDMTASGAGKVVSSSCSSRKCHGSGSAGPMPLPLWLRLEQNRVEAPRQLLDAWRAGGLELCAVPEGCTSAHCRFPGKQVHLPFFTCQQTKWIEPEEAAPAQRIKGSTSQAVKESKWVATTPTPHTTASSDQGRSDPKAKLHAPATSQRRAVWVPKKPQPEPLPAGTSAEGSTPGGVAHGDDRAGDGGSGGEELQPAQSVGGPCFEDDCRESGAEAAADAPALAGQAPQHRSRRRRGSNGSDKVSEEKTVFSSGSCSRASSRGSATDEKAQ